MPPEASRLSFRMSDLPPPEGGRRLASRPQMHGSINNWASSAEHRPGAVIVVQRGGGPTHQPRPSRSSAATRPARDGRSPCTRRGHRWQPGSPRPFARRGSSRLGLDLNLARDLSWLGRRNALAAVRLASHRGAIRSRPSSHSDEPSSWCSCFQIGARTLISSITWRDASYAATRCGDPTAIATLASPTSSRPIR